MRWLSLMLGGGEAGSSSHQQRGRTRPPEVPAPGVVSAGGGGFGKQTGYH